MQQADSSNATAAATALDIVVVDDDVSSRQAVARAVRELGHSARSAASGDMAWAMLEKQPADVVISDWRMPGLSGPDLCSRTRAASEDGRYTYFILMSGADDARHLRAGMDAGADDYQRKPLQLDELEARLISASRVIALHRRLAERTEGLRRDSKTFYDASRTDALTGLGNRFRMDQELEAARAQALRYGARYAVAIADVDEFKRYNDTFGHLAGDEALVRLADTIRREIRATDSAYRYGGEEIVILLPEQSLAEGTLAVERIRSAVERLALPTPTGEPLTISAGVAELDARTASVKNWLERADHALYRAKHAGRNRVLAAPHDD